MPREFNVRDCGAAADGRTDDTAAFQEAVESCRSAGGGVVLVPPGVYLTGPITFADGMTLHVEQGAVVRFSKHFDDYPMTPTRRMGVEVFARRPQLYARDARDIAVTGGGLFDGQGQAWRCVKKWKLTDQQWRRLVASGGHVATYQGDVTWWPSRKAFEGKAIYDAIVERIQRGERPTLDEYEGAEDYLRPTLLGFYRCRNVLLDGPSFSNSPFWNTHLVYCEDVTVRNCTFLNPWNAQNGDGLDLDSSRRVEVLDCEFAVGDDAICIKSGRDADGRRVGVPSEDIRIVDCRIRQGHGGITIGSEMSGGVRGVRAQNLTMENIQAGISIKSALGRGGFVRDVQVSDVRMTNLKAQAIRVNCRYFINDPALAPLSQEPPLLEGLRFANISCSGAAGAVLLDGLAESPIRDVLIVDARIDAERGVRLSHARDVSFHNVEVSCEEQPGLICDDVEGLDRSGLTIRRRAGET